MKKKSDSHQLLEQMRKEAISKTAYEAPREGLFRAVLKAAFAKSYEFARYCSRIRPEKADESAFFMSSALRGICEDLIVLKFLRRLNRSERDQVVTITMGLALGEALAKQDAFFKKNRPFQPILRAQSDRSRTEALRDRLTAIGQASGLWNTRGRLKPIEQMASDVKLRPLYEFMYAVTSEGVHFNPRIALRHGWGGMTKQRFSGRFSTGHYSRYYLFFCQAYGIYLFEAFCRTFKTNLSLSHAFMNRVTKLRSQLDLQIRWPEAVTFEEMNMQDPGLILRSVLQVIHEEKIKKGEARKVLQALAALESGN